MVVTTYVDGVDVRPDAFAGVTPVTEKSGKLAGTVKLVVIEVALELEVDAD